MVKPANFAAHARQWLGVPFLHQGRTKHGVDCAGLCVACAKESGLSIKDETNYARRPSGTMMRRLLSTYCDDVALSDVEVGDVLHMAFSAQPQHLAIVTGINPVVIVHADAVAGKVVEHRLSKEWVSKVRGCYRVKTDG